ASFFDGGAEHVAPVAARHEIAALETNHPAEHPGTRGIAQAKELSTDGSHGHAGLQPWTPGTGGDHHPLGHERFPALGEGRAGPTPLGVEVAPLDGRALAQLDPHALAGPAQRVEHATRVY